MEFLNKVLESGDEGNGDEQNNNAQDDKLKNIGRNSCMMVESNQQQRQPPQPMRSDQLMMAQERISYACLLYTSPSPRDKRQSRMPSSA